MFFWEFLVLGILEFIEIASVALLPRNDGILEFPRNFKLALSFGLCGSGCKKPWNFDGILDGILNEIASVALLPRNDGILSAGLVKASLADLIFLPAVFFWFIC